MDFVGIDVGKRELHVVLLQGDRSASKTVPNYPAGIAQLQTWLTNRKTERVHACLEATGGWSEAVAIALSDAGHVVSLVNPARIKAFAQSEMVRTKPDGIDGALIARFCRLHKPEPWVSPAPAILVLQGLVRRHHSLIEMKAEEQNRSGAPLIPAPVKASIEATLAHLRREIDRVQREIERLFRGLSDTSAAARVANFDSWHRGDNCSSDSGRDAEHHGVPERQSSRSLRWAIASPLPARNNRASQRNLSTSLRPV